MKFLDYLKNLLFPKGITCIFCDEEVFDNNSYSTCKECISSLPKIEGKVCLRCGKPISSMASYCERCKNNTHNFKLARACFKYEGNVRNAIRNFKFKNQQFLSEPFAKYLADLYINEKLNCDVIVFVPMFEQKEQLRGYNQSKLLAKELEKHIHVKVDETSLIKIKNTKSQSDLDFKNRQQNLNGAFKVTNKQTFKNKNVLIIDDIITTGATLDECARVLTKAGAKNVYAICIAHTMLDS